MKLCDYGCGKEVNHQFKNGKWCCSENAISCPQNRGKSKKGEKYRSPQKINNVENILCDYGCGKKAIYQFQNKKYCCSKNYAKCSIEREKMRNRPIDKMMYKKIAEKNRGQKRSKELREKLRIINTGKKISKKTKSKLAIFNKKTIKYWKQKYPTFAKIEEMRYKPGKEKEKIIQVHCKNHNCANSKEQAGWFTPTYIRLYERIRQIEKGAGGCYFYCCDECKTACPLFNSHGTDPFRIKKNKLYTLDEYQTWRITVLEREKYKCEYCDEPAIDVHHSRPQKLEPAFVLDPDFGVACCEKCHYKYGHKTGTECSTGNLANKKCL